MSNQQPDSGDKVVSFLLSGFMWYFIVGPEVFIISAIFGMMADSWWVFGITFFALIMGMAIKALAWGVTILLAICWAIIGWGIGELFSSLGASVVLGGIGLYLGFVVHIAAFGLSLPETVRSVEQGRQAPSPENQSTEKLNNGGA